MNLIDQMHDELVAKALRVHGELRDWCAANYDGGYEPVPSLLVAGYYVAMEIGGLFVWDSESGYDEERYNRDDGERIDAATCVKTYKQKLRRMYPTPKKGD